MNQPKPMQVRLPFKVPKPKKGKEPAVRICGLCRQKDSKYSCPRCNVAYCSLDCFRSQKHAQCSELFYRETIQSSIASDPSHSMEEKKHMMDILQRIKDGEEDDHAVLEMLSRQAGAGGDGELGGKLGEGSGRSWEVDEDEEELARQLEGVDIDSIDTNALFHLLPKAHRDRFIAALRNPESEDAKALVELAAKNGSDIPDVVHGAGGEAGPSKPSVTTPAQAKTMSKNNATVIGAGTDTNVIGTPTSPPPAFMVKAFSDEATALNHGPDEDVDEWDFGSDGGREPSEVKGWWECPTGSALPDGAQEDGNGPGMGDQEAATARQGKAGDRRREDTGETVVFDFDDGVTYGENVVIDGVGYAADPPLVDEAVLKAIKVPQGTGSQLRYNGIAICLAYLETASLLNIASFSPTALPSSSSRFVNALSLMHTFIPLLSTPRSTVRHLTFRSAYTSVWEAISPHLKLATQVQPSLSASGVKSDIPPHRVLLHLLEILPDLLHPPIDTTLQPRLFHVFGDLHAFYERYKKGGATRRKLAFYVVALSQMGRGEWLALEQEVQGELELLRGEFGVLDDGQGDQGVIAGGKDEGKIQGNYFP